ncbi:MAG: LuxR C-terminal-related transcriptional regulator [Friedmanniella sp.]
MRVETLRPVDVIVETKLHAPPLRPEWVSRDRLMAALDQATELPLTLIAAPAGYGKSTLVAQWLRQQRHRRTAWVGLDAADNDPVRLWTHVATALARAGAPIADDVTSFVSHNSTDMLTTVLRQVINVVAAAPEQIVIILDDFHLIRRSDCYDQVDFLIEHLPPTAALVIATRADPPLRLGRLRVSGQLVEIRAGQLSFDRTEASSMLAVQNVELPDRAVAELLERTEGWPAGLYLAALSLAGRPDPDDLVHRFTGEDRFVWEYLTEEVLGRLPVNTRSFILRMSLFERLSAAFCDHVLQTSGSAALLHQIERSNLFLISLDLERRWFRFHHLFAAVARNELEVERPAAVSGLHSRAADWFAHHGHADEAIAHALAAGNPARATALIQAHWLQYVDAGRIVTVQGWLEALQASEPILAPAASVTAAWVAALTGQEGSVEQLLTGLSDIDDDLPLPDGSHSVRSAVAMIRSTIGYGGPLDMLTAGQLAVELEASRPTTWLSTANFGFGHALYVAGDLPAAMEVLPRAGLDEAAPAIIQVCASATMSLAERERENLDRAHDHAEAAMRVVESRSIGAMPQTSLAFTVLGESEADAGDFEQAMTTLEHGLGLRRKNPGLSPWPTIHHLLAMGRVTARAGDLLRAGQLLTEANQVMSRFPDGMDAMRARLAAARAALRNPHPANSVGAPLTDRETDILRLLQGPLSLTEIAATLYLSPNTVKTHTQAIYRKLGARSRTEAVRIGRQRTLI